MTSVDKAVTARITKDHTSFEILVDPDKALQFKKGMDVSMDNLLVVREIFTDSKKGERASGSDLEKHFGTSDVLKISEQILKTGELQLTTEQRRKLLDEKKKQIANIISKQGIDPKTKLPHPPQRIINAMEDAHVSVEAFRPAEEQIQRVLDAIQEIIPISIERLEIAVKVPMQYAGKVSSIMHNLAPVKKEEWKSDAWLALIEIPAGMQADIYSKLNDMTSGQVEVKVVKRIHV